MRESIKSRGANLFSEKSDWRMDKGIDTSGEVDTKIRAYDMEIKVYPNTRDAIHSVRRALQRGIRRDEIIQAVRQAGFGVSNKDDGFLNAFLNGKLKNNETFLIDAIHFRDGKAAAFYLMARLKILQGKDHIYIETVWSDHFGQGTFSKIKKDSDFQKEGGLTFSGGNMSAIGTGEEETRPDPTVRNP